jgi:predicted nuclease with TOPRIM domain
MSDQDLRAIVFEAVGAAFEMIERRLDEKLEELAIDLEALAQRFDRLEADIREVKGHLAKLSREDIRDRRRLDRLEHRLGAVEGRKAP